MMDLRDEEEEKKKWDELLRSLKSEYVSCDVKRVVSVMV